jgi:hypothetical protein
VFTPQLLFADILIKQDGWNFTKMVAAAAALFVTFAAILGLQTTLKNVVLLVAFLVQLLLKFFSTFVIIVRDYEGMDFR